jgi:hypothetical protein
MNIPQPESTESLAVPLAERPDWALMTRSEISAVMSLSQETFRRMVAHGLIEDGTRVLGRTKMWQVGQIKELMTRLHNGEFSGVRLWGKESSSTPSENGNYHSRRPSR